MATFLGIHGFAFILCPFLCVLSLGFFVEFSENINSSFSCALVFLRGFFFSRGKDVSQEHGIPYRFASHKTARIGREDIFLPNFPIVCRDFVEV